MEDKDKMVERKYIETNPSTGKKYRRSILVHPGKGEEELDETLADGTVLLKEKPPKVKKVPQVTDEMLKAAEEQLKRMGLEEPPQR